MLIYPICAGQIYPLVYPKVILIDIVSLYLQIPLFLVCFIAWKVLAQTSLAALDKVDLKMDEYILDDGTREQMEAEEARRQGRLKGPGSWTWRMYYWLA
jgi:amino acid permease